MSNINLSPDKILVALSGGVDSSVCVRILQEQGFIVEALVISFSPAHAGAVAAAKLAAKELKVPLSVRHCEDVFETEVIAPFCDAYTKGITPNPCIRCNPRVKFSVLAEEATKRGIQYFATGHYARVEEKDGVYYVASPISAARDQSYMLYRLPQNILSRLCLPLGEFEKTEIREMAASYSLTCATAPDSQEICFIPDGKHARFIEQRGLESLQGNFINTKGEILAPHNGAAHYTVGQRRGLGIAVGHPVFVKEILPSGDVVLGKSGEEFAASILLKDIVTANGKPLQNGDTFNVKIRSTAQPTPCVVQVNKDGTSLVFSAPQRAAAPGQSAVIYSDTIVVGGGIIVSFVSSAIS